MNKLIVITGKTASGKDTVVAKLLEKFPDFKKILTTTSRAMREREINGVDYNFISKEDFKKKIENNDFIEYVEYAGNFYGTERDQLISDKNLIWRIDPSRAGKIRDLIDNEVLVIYLTVDDEVVLQRLKKRNLSQEEIDHRMKDDADFWEKYKDDYDFVVENAPGKLEETVDKVYKIILCGKK